MHISIATALSAATLVSGAAIGSRDDAPKSVPMTKLFPALPMAIFAETAGHTLTLEEALAGLNITDKIKEFADKVHDKIEDKIHHIGDKIDDFGDKLEDAADDIHDGIHDLLRPHGHARVEARATCANPRVRTEWDSTTSTEKQNFINSLKCLMGRNPSGQFPASKSRYEDFVALHQVLTPRVHGSSKFLLWHRYYMWTFEQILRDDCGLTTTFPWFDETRYAGRFAQSSIFSSQWMGSVDIGGQCVRDGQFANLAINVGPGTGNQPHCLARNNDNGKTINTGQSMVDACNSRGTYADMAGCAEGGAHAWGHNGVGAVMQDVYASPADPTFWLHHGFIDRNFRIWQNQNAGVRTTTVDGTDIDGNQLTLDSSINVYSFRPDVRIRDVLDTTSTTLCYKYNY